MKWKPHAIHSNCTVVLQYFEVVLEILIFKQKPLVALLRFFLYMYIHRFKKNPNSILEECNTQTLSASLLFLIGFFIIIIIIIIIGFFFLKGLGGSLRFFFLLNKEVMFLNEEMRE